MTEHFWVFMSSVSFRIFLTPFLSSVFLLAVFLSSVCLLPVFLKITLNVIMSPGSEMQTLTDMTESL
jgi:hypothetical protein